MELSFIAITQRVEIIEEYNEIRDCLDIRWSNLVLKCGYLPYILPNNLSIVKLILKNVRFQGILLTGGNNLCKYGGNSPERDETEHYLIEYSIKNKLPLLGICRGMQVIQDYFNIKLYKVSNHVSVEHKIKYKDFIYTLNSYHNYGTTQNNKELDVIFSSEDSVVEMIKHKKYKIYGMMHHPERINPFREIDIEFIKNIMKT